MEDSLVGETLGHYRILEKLGAGGMGEVYRAVDATLDREVALKILPPEFAASQERLERFRREAKTLAALDHPNIVIIYSVESADVGESLASSREGASPSPEEARTLHFFTMQLVDGRRLSECIPGGGMPLEQIFDLAIPLVDALATAHEKGVIHRDLKPANIMVSDEGRLRVLDFGLAKFRQESQAPVATQLSTEPLTEEGRIIGTIPYMSPEQLEGKDLDARTDVFSLGVILYEMATGRRPFQGESSASLISSIMTETPREIDEVRVDLPHHLARIVGHCLEKDPDRRFHSLKDVRNELASLRDEIRRASDSRGSVPVPDSSTPKPVKLEPAATVRPKGWWLGLIGPVVAVAVVLWFLLGRSDEAPRPQEAPISSAEREDATFPVSQRKMIVVLPFENLGPPEDAYFADGMTEEITSRLAAVSGLGVISRTTATQYDTTGKTLKELGADLGVDFVLEGTVRWSHPTEGPSRVLITPQLIRVADDTHLWSDRYDRQLEDIFTVQAEVAQQVIDLLEITLLATERERLESRPTENMEAYQAYLRGMENASRSGGIVDQDWNLATTMFERAVGLDPDFALAWARLCWSRASAIWVGQAERDWGPARRAAERALELQPDLPEANYAQGLIHYWAEGEYDLALERFALARAGRPSEAEIVTGIGAVHRRRGDWDQALTSWQAAAELDPRSSGVLSGLGETLLWMHRYPEADAVLARSISLGPDQVGAYADRWWVRIHWRGNLQESREVLDSIPVTEPGPYSYWSEYAQLWLERDFEKLLQKVKETDEFRCMGCSSVYRRLYEPAAYRALGDADRSQAAYREAAKRLEEEARQFPDRAGIQSRLGEAYAGLGNKDAAIREGRLAVELLPVSKDAMSGSVREEALAHIYVMVGEAEAALDLLERLLTIPSQVSVNWLRLDPSWDPLRDHSRFQALLERYGQGAE